MTAPGGNYQLGIDLGTTYTAAAVARDGRFAVAGLGNRAASIPSVIYLRPDGTVLTGEAASRRGSAEPERVAREFKRRFGDPTPLLLGGTPYSAEALTARLLRWVVEKVTELEGGPPGQIAVTHPANWGPYKKDLLEQALRLAGVEAMMLAEPAAAAIAYAANERVEPGALVAVYDLGGGTFDAAVLRKTADGFAVLGQPEGIERLGGIDFDEAVFEHVRSALGGAIEQLDFDEPQTIAALSRLRTECIDAKEALSTDTETSVAALLPGLQTEVRLTRAEFEQLVRPTLTETVSALRRALTTASVEPAQVTAVLLVGGSSRIPLVAELVSDALGRPVAVDAHPKHAIALGAAHAAVLRANGPLPQQAVATAIRRADEDSLGSIAPILDSPTAGLAGAAAVAQIAVAPAAESVDAPTVGDGHHLPPVQFSDAPTMPAGPPPQPRRHPRTLLWAGLLAGGVLGLGAWVVNAVVLAADETPDRVAADQPDEVSVADDPVGAADTDADGQAAADDESEREAEEAAVADSEPEDNTAPDGMDDTGVPPGQDFVTIDAINLDGDTYLVDFTTHEFEAQLPGQHVHFFFDTVAPDEAGVPGGGPWILYGGPSPFTEYTTADRPAQATRMCALVANPDHSVVADSGICVDLP
jgi:molecular chaperone DnaK